MSQENVPARQCVCNNVVLSLLVLNDIREGLQKFHPASMAPIEVSLALQVTQRGMITVDDKFTRPKVVLPGLQHAH